jgi:branched-chain amino acid transport system substrate-binding protein
MKKIALMLLGGSLFFVATLALSPTPARCAPEVITIGGVFSLTGADSSVGNQVRAGYTIAIEDINKDGGVYVKEFGKKIPLELQYLDMEANPEKAISRTETLYSRHKVVAYVGTTFFSAAVTIVERQKVPAVVVASASQSIHDRGFKYWFTPSGTSVDIAREIFNLFDSLPKDQRPAKSIIFEEQSDWGIEMSRYWQKQIKARGYQLESIQKYSMLARDYSPQIMAAKTAGADLVLSNPIMPDGMSIMRQMKQLDYNPKAVVMIRAPDDLPWTRAMQSIGDYVIFSTGWHHGLDLPGVAELNARHEAEFHRPADVMTGPAYASIQIIADAIKRAGTLDPVKVRDALAATDMMTVVGPIKFRQDGTVVGSLGVIAQWQNGKQEMVWPDKCRTKPLIYPMPKWSER